MPDEEQEKSSQQGPGPRSLSTPIMVGSLAALIMAVVFVVAILRGGSGDAGRAEGPIPRRSEARAPEQAPAAVLKALSPQGSVPKEGLVFKWSRVEGLDGYEVVVYDTLMKKVWSSPRVTGEQIEPPEKIRDYLRAGTPYRWKVIGTRNGGGSAESASLTFRLVE